ncbi:MAG TPA: PAS domain S-box protein [Verrucomicrobiae bacterium]|nr:PAS domain S-box protein [Verrucomicrobiae bacterium]
MIQNTLGRPNLVVIPAVAKDQLYAKDAIIRSHKIGFYAGVPLITPEGHAFGVLCVMDVKPHDITAAQEDALRRLGRQTVAYLETVRLRRELAASEERLRIVTDNARVGVVVVNRERRYVYANKAYAELLQLPSPDIVGKLVREVLPAMYEEQISPRLDKAFAGSRVAYEGHLALGKTEHYYDIRYEPMMENGGVASVVVALTDITERKRTEQRLMAAGRFAQSTIDALSAHLCVLDKKGIILASNEAWRAFAAANRPSPQSAEIGDNYLAVCDRATGPDAQDAANFAAGIRAVLSDERDEFSMEYPCHSPMEIRWFVGRVTRFYDEGAACAVVTHENITLRKQAEIAASRLAAIVKFSDDAIISKDLQSVVTTWNHGAEKVFGYTAEEMVGASIMQLIPTERRDEEDLILGKIRAGESVEHFETERQTKDGRRIHVSVTASPIKDASGKIIGVSKVARDISESKRAREHAVWLASFPEQNPNPILELDLATGIIHYANDAAIRLAPENLANGVLHPLTKSLLEDYRTARDHKLQSTYREVAVGEFFFSQHITRVPETGRLRVYSSDITARKKADEARKASEERYRALFEYAPDGILIANAEGIYLDANASMCSMLGYTPEQLIGLQARDIVSEAEVPHIQPALNIIKAKSMYHREWNFRRKDGSIFPTEVIAALMPDGNVLAMIRDITERKRTEARFRRLVESNAQGVMFANNQGQISGANDALLNLLGYTREDLEAGRINWATLTPPEYDEVDRRGVKEMITKGACTPYEKEYFRKDGTRVPVLIGAASFEDDLNEGVCFVIDLTERKKLEQQFLRAQRMESIGTLAGGIAHDLNNVLAPILMSVAVLKDLAQTPEDINLLATLEKSAHRGADLVKQVLSFARGVKGQRIPVNLEHLIRDLIKVMEDTFPKSIDIRFKSAEKLWMVTGDPTQMHQVFLNLCVNARDAMPNGGHLSITLENVVLDETYAAMNPDSQPGPYVMVKVADTGTGIPREIRDRVFEPFFTTKDIGHGTGLGLSTTLAIVKSHNGIINLYSEIGQGTKFKVYLPADSSEVSREQVAIEQTRLPRGNNELILVVDDEAAIRQVAHGTLVRFGYRVLEAVNGAEGVALYAQHRADIAVVLTDMAMPIMDGPAMIIALRSINPLVRIIGSSGLSASGGAAEAVGAGVQHFVPKPYTAETLLKTLKKVLTDSPKVTGG